MTVTGLWQSGDFVFFRERCHCGPARTAVLLVETHCSQECAMYLSIPLHIDHAFVRGMKENHRKGLINDGATH